MPHENKLIVRYIIRQGNSISTDIDEYIWDGHRYLHQLDHYDNLVISKMPNPPEPENHKIHVKTYAKGTWATVEFDYDEHDI